MKTIEPKLYLDLVHRFEQLCQMDQKEGDNPQIISFDYLNDTRVMGVHRANNRLIMHLFHRVEDFHLFLAYLNEEMVKADAMFRINMIQMDYQSVEDMVDEEYIAYQKAGLDIEEKEEIPLFRNFKEGHSMWIPQEGDYVFMMEAMRLYEAILEKSKGELVDGHYGWDGLEIVTPWFYEMKETPYSRIGVSELLPKLNFRKRGTWLIGIYYLPFPLHMDLENRPKLPLMCVVVDEEATEIVHVFEAEPESSATIFCELLYDYMKTHRKRPRAVAFFDESDHACLEDLFVSLDVEVVESEEMYLLNDVWIETEEKFIEFLDEHPIVNEDSYNIH